MATKKSNPKKAKLDAKVVMEELKAPGLIILGMIGGNLAGKLVDKAVKVDDTATSFQAKALLKPVVQIAVGLGGSILLKDKNLKLIASGVAASGIASTVKVFLKKDILQGLTSFAGLGEPDTDSSQRVFREPLNLAIEPYNPSLPQLPAAQVEAIPVETDTEVSGADLGDYQEIQEVPIL